MPDPVLFETLVAAQGKAIGVATLNSEKTLNSLSLPMIDLLSEKLREWERDLSIVLVVVQGAGERAFSAGGDIQDLYESMCKHPGGPNPYADAFFEREYRLDYQMHTYSKPIVAWAHGFVMGGGLGVMAACSHRLGTTGSRIAMPEITIGLFPDAGATWFLSRMPTHFAYFLAWTGCHINAVDGKQVGLIDHLVDISNKADVMQALIDADWTDDGNLNRTIVDEVIGRFETDSSEFPASVLQEHDDSIQNLVDAALNAPRPAIGFDRGLDSLDLNDKWLDRARATFRGGSPTTAHLIHEQITRASGMTLKETFMLEFVMAIQCSRHPDFVEGIRALLIDRDNKPAWRFENLPSVKADWVMEHFMPPFEGKHPLSDLGE